MRVIKKKKEKGFTLLEMSIAVAIAGMLAAFSVNEYTKYVVTSHKKAVQAKIMEIASTLERDYTQNGEYRDSFVSTLNKDKMSSEYRGNSSFVRYSITITRTDSQSYSIRAVPNGVQDKKDPCGWLQINNFGIKSYQHSNVDISRCW